MTLQNPKILLYVEDHAIVRLITTRILEDEGYEVLVANDGAAALSILTSEKRCIAAIVTDIKLGGALTGWHVARSGRVRLSNMPVLYTSSVSQLEWVANRVPFSKLIVKPFRPSHVINALASLLAPKRPKMRSSAVAFSRESEQITIKRQTASDSEIWI